MRNCWLTLQKRELSISGDGLGGGIYPSAQVVPQINPPRAKEDRSRTVAVKGEIVPVIVLAGHTAALGVIRALGSMGVPLVSLYYERRDIGRFSKYVRENIHVPHPEKDEEKFVRLLLDYSRKIGEAVLLPLDDAMLSAVSKHKPLLEQHYLVACPDPDITEQVIDKKHTYALAELIGVAAPKTLIPNSEEDLEAFAGQIGYPCLIKPRQSHLYVEV
jgi:predicted ATP-grasp superfamily ATP-dependent carboligase